MLSFVGLGISGFESIPIEGLEAISKADHCISRTIYQSHWKIRCR